MARPAVIVHHPHTLASTSPQTWKPTFGVTTGCTIASYGASPLCSDCLSRNRLIGASAESGYLRSRVAQSRGAVPVSVAGGDARSLGRDGQVRDSLAWGMVGSKSSTGLPEGSSAMICLPPTPVTKSLRNRTPSRRRCVMAPARSGTATANRFQPPGSGTVPSGIAWPPPPRSEEHTSELQSRPHLVCRLLLEKKKT